MENQHHQISLTVHVLACPHGKMKTSAGSILHTFSRDELAHVKQTQHTMQIKVNLGDLLQISEGIDFSKEDENLDSFLWIRSVKSI